MSTLNEEQVGLLVRRRLGLPPATRLRFVPLIPAALLRTVEKCAARDDLRHWVLTDKATTTAALDGSGVAGLSTLVTTPRIQLHLLRYGNIYHADSTFPLRPLEEAAHGQLAGALDTMFLRYWLEGTNLCTRSADGNTTPLSGPLSFAVPYWMTLAQLPEALVEKEQVGLVDSIIELLAEEPDGDDEGE
jgi:hypothetical protein